MGRTHKTGDESPLAHLFKSPHLKRLAQIAHDLGATMMPSWNQLFENVSVAAQAIVTTAETTVATLTVNNPSGIGVILFGLIVMTFGTGTTSVTCRIRQDTIAGTARNNPTAQNVTAGNTGTLVAVGLGAATEAASRTYVLTVAQAAATANGSVVECGLIAIGL